MDDEAPTRSRPWLDRLIRIGGGIVTVWAATLLAIVESFLVPARIGDAHVPLAGLIAVVGNVALPLLMLYLTRHRLVALLPGLAWFVVVIMATSPTSEGDLIITSMWTGVVLLIAGAGTIAVMGYLLLASGTGRRFEAP